MRWSLGVGCSLAWVLGAACVSIPDSNDASGGQAGAAGTGGSSGSGGSSMEGGAATGGTLPVDDGGNCPSGFKRCGASCASVDDVNFGCGPTTCDPCQATTRVTGMQCTAGACAVATCESGWGDCNDDLSDGCEHDVTSDSDHCGACDWSCFGTNCSQGICGPKTILGGLASAGDIVVYGDTVHTVDANSKGVRTVDRNGVAKAGPDVGFGRALTEDANYVYIVNSTAIYRWPKASPAPTLDLVSVTPSTNLQNIAVDDTYAYVSDWDNVDTATIYRANKTTLGGPASAIYTGPKSSRIRGIVTDGTTIFVSIDNGLIARLPAADPSAADETLKQGSQAWGMVIADSTLFWRSGSAQSGSVFGTATSSGSSVAELFSGQPEPRQLVHTNGRLFWTTDKALVMADPKVPQVSSSLTYVGTESRGMAADDDFVFYTTYVPFPATTGQLIRFRQPPPGALSP